MGLEFGIGFGLGIAVGIQLSKVLWYADKESVWEKHKRENISVINKSILKIIIFIYTHRTRLVTLVYIIKNASKVIKLLNSWLITKVLPTELYFVAVGVTNL